MRALLESSGLRIEVPGRVLVSAFSFALRAGEFVAVLGGNGTGKSLLLRTLAGLRPAASGQVTLEGRPIAARPRREVARGVGFLPQDADAPPQGSLHDAVLLGRFAHLGFWRPARHDDLRRVAQALADVGLAGMDGRDLASFSGGEQRRAALARLLVQAPSVYLLDEPTNHLDPAQQIGVLSVLRGLASDGAAVIASLHEPNLALRFAHRILLLSGNGPVELVDTPALVPAHLEKLYGLGYQEARIDGRRVMMPA